MKEYQSDLICKYGMIDVIENEEYRADYSAGQKAAMEYIETDDYENSEKNPYTPDMAGFLVWNKGWNSILLNHKGDTN